MLFHQGEDADIMISISEQEINDISIILLPYGYALVWNISNLRKSEATV